MSPLEQVLTGMAVRRRRRTLFVVVSRVAFWSCVVALLIRGLHEVVPFPGALVCFALLPFLAVVAAAAFAWRRRRTPAAMAREIDGVLETHDQFATALECVSRGQCNEVEQLLVQRASSQVAAIAPERVIPSQTPVEAKLLVVVVPVFLVFFGSFCYREALRLVTPYVQRTVLAQPLALLQQKVDELKSSDDPTKRDVADRLKNLLNELQSAKNFDEMLGKAKTLLDQLKSAENDPDAAQALDQLGQVAEFLSRSKVTRQLAEALKQGDLQKAADLTRTLAEQIRKSTGMTQQDLERIAENFRQSANVTRVDGGRAQSGAG